MRRLAPLVALLTLLAGCGSGGVDGAGVGGTDEAGAARLTADPSAWSGGPAAAPGLHRLPVDRGPEALLYVPRSAAGDGRVPLLLALPGAGNDTEKVVEAIRPHADRTGAVVLGVGFRSGRWDVLLGGFGRDVRVIDSMLARTFRRVHVDPRRVGVAGYSDGASYALSLARANGGLLRNAVAFSPGFMAEVEPRGKPEITITHGTEDPVLPIGRTSRVIVPQLQDAGLEVRYREFEGGHKIPHPLLPWALRWLAD